MTMDSSVCKLPEDQSAPMIKLTEVYSKFVKAGFIIDQYEDATREVSINPASITSINKYEYERSKTKSVLGLLDGKEHMVAETPEEVEQKRAEALKLATPSI